MSKKIHALIVDDEELARENLAMLIADFCPDVAVIGTAANAKQARELVDELDPDLVFLDIMMPGEDGFAWLKTIEERTFQVVFTTAHNEYALKAFKEKAIDYLEKPINIDELQGAVNRVSQLLENHRQSPISDDRLTKILENIALTNTTEKIAIPTRDGLAFVQNNEIIHLDAHDSYTVLYLTENRKYVSSKTIKTFEEKLNKGMFFRIHKSHIINIAHHLKEYNRSEGNIAIMSNGAELPISRRKMSQFMERISDI
ncbi:MAG: LytTR family DNA-binding domain-containing protein [Flavobacteriales bacterium]|nr:LytTR family DNA-binding domain-containing protein [Flavobacteriales bacterium]